MIPYSRPKHSDLYTSPRVKCLKTIPFTVSHTYIAHIWQYPPAPPGVFPLRETELWSKQKTMGQWVRGEANGDSTPKES